jgi:hypothetical protein
MIELNGDGGELEQVRHFLSRGEKIIFRMHCFIFNRTKEEAILKQICSGSIPIVIL